MLQELTTLLVSFLRTMWSIDFKVTLLLIRTVYYPSAPSVLMRTWYLNIADLGCPTGPLLVLQTVTGGDPSGYYDGT